MENQQQVAFRTGQMKSAAPQANGAWSYRQACHVYFGPGGLVLSFVGDPRTLGVFPFVSSENHPPKKKKKNEPRRWGMDEKHLTRLMSIIRSYPKRPPPFSTHVRLIALTSPPPVVFPKISRSWPRTVPASSPARESPDSRKLPGRSCPRLSNRPWGRLGFRHFLFGPIFLVVPRHPVS